MPRPDGLVTANVAHKHHCGVFTGGAATLDEIKTEETSYINGTHSVVTLSATQGSYTKKSSLMESIIGIHRRVRELMRYCTGSAALKTTTSSDAKAVFKVGSTYYTYDTTKLQTVCGLGQRQFASRRSGNDDT